MCSNSWPVPPIPRRWGLPRAWWLLAALAAILVLILAYAAEAAEWVKVDLTERGYYDPRTGTPLKSIEGRQNRPGIDPFVGGGKTGYPSIEISKIEERHESGTSLLIKAILKPEEADSFRDSILTDEQAKQIKKDVFGITPISGVTK
jgi:hypothetical protein